MLELSALELSQRIRDKELQIPEVVDFYLQRIQAVNPKLNAVVEDNFSAAREKAKEQQAHLDSLNAEERKKLPVFLASHIPVKKCSLLRVKNQRWDPSIVKPMS